MACLPNNQPTDPSCVNQTLSIDCDTGDLTISGSQGNIVNLGCVVPLFETQTTLSSFALNGNILTITYIGEDGVPQTRFVDLTPIINAESELNFINTNSISLTDMAGTVRADLNIDPASTLPISASSSGVKFDCCPQTAITVNNTNTVNLVSTGSLGHILTANIKYQSTPSIALADTSSGLNANVVYSTDANNVATSGTDGGIFVRNVASQLSTLSLNGFITTGSSGTLLVGSDSKLYRVPTPGAETPITPIDSNSINLTVNGTSNHTIQADVNTVNSNTIQLVTTGSGIQANLKVSTASAGNVAVTNVTDGIQANITGSTIATVQSNAATVATPLTKIYGQRSDTSAGYAAVTMSQYGIKFPGFTTSQRTSIPGGDLYDTLFVFDTTLRKFMWYDAVNTVWIQIG